MRKYIVKLRKLRHYFKKSWAKVEKGSSLAYITLYQLNNNESRHTYIKLLLKEFADSDEPTAEI